MTTIDKIYFITHPAFAMGEVAVNVRRDPKEIEAFIKQSIIPVIIRAQHEPNSLVVLLRSAFGIEPKQKRQIIEKYPRRQKDALDEQQRPPSPR